MTKTAPRSLPQSAWSLAGVVLMACLGRYAAGQESPPALIMPQPPQPTFFYKRLDHRSEQELREQLLKVRELDIKADAPEQHANLDGELRAVQAFRKAGVNPTPKAAEDPSDTLTKFHQEACEALGLSDPAGGRRLGREDAKNLVDWSARLRRAGLVSMPDLKGGMVTPNWKTVSREQLQGREKLDTATGLAAFAQMLPTEDARGRQLLIALLKENDTAAATVVLARQAIFDPAPENRRLALAALTARPAAQYRAVFLEALRHPWLPAAQHAAESLAALQDDAAVPALKVMLAEPDPAAPVVTPEAKTPQIRELVRINHLRNCLLCHAASVQRTDPLRAPVPTPGTALTPAYYAERSIDGAAVRADVTYVRQEFSVLLPVADAKPWPEHQRFDFVIRRREATKDELAALDKAAPAQPSWPQREAILFALGELKH